MLPLRQLLCTGRRALVTGRHMSSTPLVDVTVDNDGVAIVTLQRPPVNSLNLELIEAISTSLDDLSKNKARSMIMTSSSSRVFSGGLDIMEMYKPDPKRSELFWRTLQDMWIKLYGAPFITAAAVNGHAPAGGCLLAMSCEYRVMTSGVYSIGLNETALGIVAPPWFMDTMRNTVPARQAELALTQGRMFTVDEALQVGMIDETANDKEDAIAKCKKFIKKYDKIPPQARAATKQMFRQAAIKALQTNKENDVKLFLDVINQPRTQKALESYIAKLKEKAQ